MRDTILQLASQAKRKIVVAESCTGGMLAAALTDLPGSSAVFERGFVTYSNAAKIELLGVSADTLERHGAVSEPVAKDMARGALERSGGDIALAVLGIPGEALAHGANRHALGEMLENGALAGLPFTFDKLHHTNPHIISHSTYGEAKSRRRFSLALAGMDHQQALLFRLGRQHAIARGLALAHALGVMTIALGLAHVLLCSHCAASP